MITKQQKAQWLAALRSGNYQKGTTCLRAGNGGHETFCVLGVLADVLDSAKWKHSDHGSLDWAWGTETVGLPDTVLAEHVQVTLVAANDEYGWDFNRIADAIEGKASSLHEGINLADWPG